MNEAEQKLKLMQRSWGILMLEHLDYLERIMLSMADAELTKNYFSAVRMRYATIVHENSK